MKGAGRDGTKLYGNIYYALENDISPGINNLNQ